nr:hypothetical protein CFP56_24374 [Quercus suber]
MAESRQFNHTNLPAKLRCASCNLLAVDAVKLPCCDQAICEPCSKDLSDTCPVCEHSPVAAEECKPHRNLRMTVRAFLKGEEKKNSKDTPVVASVETIGPPPSLTPGPVASETPVNVKEESVQVDAGERMDVDQYDAPNGQHAESEPVHLNEGATTEDDHEEDDEDDIVVTTEKDGNLNSHGEQDHAFGQDHPDAEHAQSQMNDQQTFGFGNNQQGFNNTNFNSMNGFNPMMAMQNSMGMPGFNMGMPNMMGEFHQQRDISKDC